MRRQDALREIDEKIEMADGHIERENMAAARDAFLAIKEHYWGHCGDSQKLRINRRLIRCYRKLGPRELRIPLLEWQLIHDPYLMEDERGAATTSILASLYAFQGKVKQAEACLRGYPNNNRCHVVLIDLLRREKRYDEAKKAIQAYKGRKTENVFRAHASLYSVSFDFNEAETLLLFAIENVSEDTHRLRKELAYLYKRMGRREESETLFKSLLEQSNTVVTHEEKSDSATGKEACPDKFQHLMFLAEQQMKKANYEAALKHLIKIKAIVSTHGKVNTLLAKCYLALKRKEEALSIYLDPLHHVNDEIQSEYVDYLYTQERDKEALMIEERAEFSTHFKFQRDRAFRLFRKKQIREAINLLYDVNSALDYQPIVLDLMRFHCELGQPEKGLKIYDTCALPSSLDLELHRIDCIIGMGNYREAMQAYANLSKKNPLNLFINQKIARLLRLQNDIEGEEKILQHPSMRDIEDFRLDYVYFLLRHDRFESALDELNLLSSSIECVKLKARCFYRLNRISEADELLKSIKLDSLTIEILRAKDTPLNKNLKKRSNLSKTELTLAQSLEYVNFLFDNRDFKALKKFFHREKHLALELRVIKVNYLLTTGQHKAAIRQCQFLFENYPDYPKSYCLHVKALLQSEKVVEASKYCREYIYGKYGAKKGAEVRFFYSTELYFLYIKSLICINNISLAHEVYNECAEKFTAQENYLSELHDLFLAAGHEAPFSEEGAEEADYLDLVDLSYSQCSPPEDLSLDVKIVKAVCLPDSKEDLKIYSAPISTELCKNKTMQALISREEKSSPVANIPLLKILPHQILTRLQEVASAFPLFLGGGFPRDFLANGRFGTYDLDCVAFCDPVALSRFLGTEVNVSKTNLIRIKFPECNNLVVDIYCVSPTSLKENALTKDAYLNTLLVCPFTGNVFDPTGKACIDIAKREINPIGDLKKYPESHESQIRLMRFIALSTKKFTLTPEVQREIKEIAPACLLPLIKSQPQRIIDQLHKIMMSGNSATGMRLLRDLGFLDLLFPHSSCKEEKVKEQEELKRGNQTNEMTQLILKCESVDLLPVSQRFYLKQFIYATILAARMNKESSNAYLEAVRVHKLYVHLIPQSFDIAKLFEAIINIYKNKLPEFVYDAKESDEFETNESNSDFIPKLTLENIDEVYHKIKNKLLNPNQICILLAYIDTLLQEHTILKPSENLKNLIYLGIQRLNHLDEWLENKVKMRVNRIRIANAICAICRIKEIVPFRISEATLSRLTDKYIAEKNDIGNSTTLMIFWLVRLEYKNQAHFRALFRLLVLCLDDVSLSLSPKVSQSIAYCVYELHESLESLGLASGHIEKLKEKHRLFSMEYLIPGRDDAKLHAVLQKKLSSFAYEYILESEAAVHGFSIDSFITFPDQKGGSLKIAIEYDGSVHYAKRANDKWRDALLMKAGIMTIRVPTIGILSKSKIERIISRVSAEIHEAISKYPTALCPRTLFPKLPRLDPEKERKQLEREDQQKKSQERKRVFAERVAEKNAEAEEKERKAKEAKAEKLKIENEERSRYALQGPLERLALLEKNIQKAKAMRDQYVETKKHHKTGEIKSEADYRKCLDFIKRAEDVFLPDAKAEVEHCKLARKIALAEAREAELKEKMYQLSLLMKSAISASTGELAAPPEVPQPKSAFQTEIASVVEFIKENKVAEVSRALNPLIKKMPLSTIVHEGNNLLAYVEHFEMANCLIREFKFDINAPVNKKGQYSLHCFIDSISTTLIRYCLTLSNLDLQVAFEGLNPMAYLLFEAMPGRELFSIIKNMAVVYDVQDQPFFSSCLQRLVFEPYNTVTKDFILNSEEMLQNNNKAIQEIVTTDGSNVFHLICNIEDDKWHGPLANLFVEHNKEALNQRNANGQTPEEYARFLKKDKLAQRFLLLKIMKPKPQDKKATVSAAAAAPSPILKKVAGGSAAAPPAPRDKKSMTSSRPGASPMKEARIAAQNKSWFSEIPANIAALDQALNTIHQKIQDEKCNIENVILHLKHCFNAIHTVHEHRKQFSAIASFKVFQPQAVDAEKWRCIQSRAYHYLALVELRKASSNQEVYVAQIHLLKALLLYPTVSIADQLIRTLKSVGVKGIISKININILINIKKYANYFRDSRELGQVMELFNIELITQTNHLLKNNKDLEGIKLFKMILFLKTHFSLEKPMVQTDFALYGLSKLVLEKLICVPNLLTQEEIIRVLGWVIIYGSKKGQLREANTYLEAATRPSHPWYINPTHSPEARNFALQMRSLIAEEIEHAHVKHATTARPKRASAF